MLCWEDEAGGLAVLSSSKHAASRCKRGVAVILKNHKPLPLPHTASHCESGAAGTIDLLLPFINRSSNLTTTQHNAVPSLPQINSTSIIFPIFPNFN